MSSNLANDLGFLIDELGPSPSNEQRALSATRARQFLEYFYWFEGGILKPNQLLENKFTNFKLALQSKLKNLLLSTEENTGRIIVDIQLANGIVRMNIGKVFVSTGLTFIMWSIGASVILFSIAIIFLRGQVRPILRLPSCKTNWFWKRCH